MAGGLTRQQMISAWRGLQGLIRGMPADQVPTDSINGLSDDALLARIRSQQTYIDNNGAVMGVRPITNPDGAVPVLGDPAPAPATTRATAIATLRGALANPQGAVDMQQFHAILAAYSDGQTLTIPDLTFDTTISDAERSAATLIAERLERGENAPDIRREFTTRAATIETEQRTAAELEARRIADATAAARQQGNLDATVDAHLAAGGYITPDQIGKLTAEQRANWMTQFIMDNQRSLMAPGAVTARLPGLREVQSHAIDMQNGYALRPGAIEVLTAGRQSAHMAEEVRTWLESGDPNKIMMAQAILGTQVTGQLNADTHRLGEALIRRPYETNLANIPGIQNITGGISPSETWRAANEGRIYIPTDAELRAAGVDEATLASIAAARPASEILADRNALESIPRDQLTEQQRALYVLDTREELIANLYVQNPQLYTQIVTARNAVAADVRLGVASPDPAVAQAEFNERYDSIPATVATTDPNSITLADGRVYRDLPPGVRDMMEAKRLVEEATARYDETTRMTGGLYTDPVTGREVFRDVMTLRMEAERLERTAQDSYMALEDSLRREGRLDEVTSYIRRIENGEIQPSPAVTPETVPERIVEPAPIVVGSLTFSTDATRGGVVPDPNLAFARAVTPEEAAPEETRQIAAVTARPSTLAFV